MLLMGIDEVGRGCWAGPLLAAAVVLDPAQLIGGLADSKKLTGARRHELSVMIHAQSLAVGIGWVWPAEIDTHGLTAAVSSAMRQAADRILMQLPGVPINIIIDGNYNFLPGLPRTSTLVGADGTVPAVSAASIVAKVARDNYMSTVAAQRYPDYGFEKHVGYGTLLHRQALAQHGVTDIHRTSYKPIHAYMPQA